MKKPSLRKTKIAPKKNAKAAFFLVFVPVEPEFLKLAQIFQREVQYGGRVCQSSA